MAPRRRARPGLRRHLLLRSRPLLLLLLPPLLPPPRAASAATPRVFCYVVVATPAEEALAAVHRREGTHRAHCDAITFFGDRRTPLLTPFLPPGAGPGALVTPKGGPAWFGAPVTLNLPVFLALWRHLRDARTLEAGGWDWVVKLDADALLSPGPRGLRARLRGAPPGVLMNVRSRRPDGSEELRLIGPVVAWSAGAFRTFLAGVDRCHAKIDHAGARDGVVKSIDDWFSHLCADHLGIPTPYQESLLDDWSLRQPGVHPGRCGEVQAWSGAAVMHPLKRPDALLGCWQSLLAAAAAARRAEL